MAKREWQIADNKKGQVMLLTVVVLSATILGATTIAGLLTMYQVRQSTDIINSGKAIFAADAGLECEYYRIDNPAFNCADVSASFTNGASFTTTILQVGPPLVIRSVGTAGTAVRAFEAEL
jgi:hypothetical protein